MTQTDRATRWRVQAGPSVVAALLILLTPGTVDAACTDFADPGVDWKGCKMNDQSFIEIDLTGARLRNGRFYGSDFSRAILAKTDSRDAKFIGALLVEANLDGARLGRADFTKADLTGASLKKADLRRAKMFRAILRGADLTGARLKGADLLAADLSGATWVDGKTICAEGSIGQCNRRPKGARETSS